MSYSIVLLVGFFLGVIATIVFIYLISMERDDE